jgi:hypothetical protein
MTMDDLYTPLLAILDKGVRLEPEGNRLHVDAPRGVLNLDEVSLLLHRRADIMVLLLDLGRPRLTGQEFADHLLAQALKAFQSARQAKAGGHPGLFRQEWARGLRLRQAGLDVISNLHHENEYSCVYQPKPPTSTHPIERETNE